MTTANICMGSYGKDISRGPAATTSSPAAATTTPDRRTGAYWFYFDSPVTSGQMSHDHGFRAASQATRQDDVFDLLPLGTLARELPFGKGVAREDQDYIAQHDHRNLISPVRQRHR